MADKKPRRWMQKAVPKSREGIFTAKAKAAGKSVQEYAQEKQHAPGALGKQARFALTAKKVADSDGGKSHPLYNHPRSKRD